MEGLEAKLVWFFTNADAHEVLAPLVLPIVIGLGLYQSHYPYVLLRALWVRAFGDGFVPLTAADAPPLGMTIPTLLRNDEDLEGIFTSLRSVASCGYPGMLAVVVAVDGIEVAPKQAAALRAFVAGLHAPSNFHFSVTGAPERQGKGMAGDHGVQHLLALAERRAIPHRPRILFNMDADCEIRAFALERMVRALMRPSRITGQMGMVVTSHVAIRERDYLPRLADLFTVKGWIAVTVAREYLVAIGLGRTNAMRLLPQNGASGALYCTWTEVFEAGPAWARLLTQLRWRDFGAWWLGAPPPVFDPRTLAPLPEGMTGMGDDTWMSWLACAARWEDGRLTLALPRTPAHAAWYALVAFVARPFRYDPLAKVYTTTPTSLKALFKQRARWNVSRIWTVQRWGIGLLYHQAIGIPAIVDVVISTAFQAIIVVGLVLSPFAGPVPAMAPALFVLVELAYGVERTVSTALAMLLDRDERGQWKKLLGLPFAGVFHLAFNVLATIQGFVAQVLGAGFNDGFAPEETLIRGVTGRIALGYRIGRFYRLAWRAVRQGDVPLGWFWLGWSETKWTRNGYAGWTATARPAAGALAAPEVASAAVPEAPPAEITDDDDVLPDSGVRPRPSLAPSTTRSVA